MKRVLVAAVLLSSSVSFAKAWNGIDPGISHGDDVLKKFGEPTKTVENNGTRIFAYFGKEAIKGTTQTQFRVDPNKVVERIDVFPGPVVDKDAVEATYGPLCPASGQSSQPCYVKKLTDDFRTYFLYAKLGLAVFFNDDGKTVQSFIFQPQKSTSK